MLSAQRREVTARAEHFFQWGYRHWIVLKFTPPNRFFCTFLKFQRGLILPLRTPLSVTGFQSIISVLSGLQFGTVVTLVGSGLLASTRSGWPSIYYVSGAFGIVWVVLWLSLGSETPDTNRLITQSEKNYIKSSLTQTISGKKVSTGIVVVVVFFYIILTALEKRLLIGPRRCACKSKSDNNDEKSALRSRANKPPGLSSTFFEKRTRYWYASYSVMSY